MTLYVFTICSSFVPFLYLLMRLTPGEIFDRTIDAARQPRRIHTMTFHMLFDFEDLMNHAGCGSDQHDSLWILALLVGVLHV
jgi:hypothetical protein